MHFLFLCFQWVSIFLQSFFRCKLLFLKGNSGCARGPISACFYGAKRVLENLRDQLDNLITPPIFIHHVYNLPVI